MRSTFLAFTTAAILLAAPQGFAAPTCQDRDGDTIRCGTAGAMPVGWTLPADQRQARDMARPPEPVLQELALPILLIGGLMALIALMPRFDGWSAGDWDAEDEERQ
jgi:hypothetical protein